MKSKIKILSIAFVCGCIGCAALFFLVTRSDHQAQAQDQKAANKTESTASTGQSAWNIRCTEQTADQPKVCEMFQQLSMAETGQRLLEIGIAKPDGPDKPSRAVVVLPLGIFLQPGVMLQVDENSQYKFHVNHCGDQGCIAYIDMNDDLIAEMKAGQVASLTMYTLEKKALKIGASLTGFTGAYNKLSSL